MAVKHYLRAFEILRILYSPLASNGRLGCSIGLDGYEIRHKAANLEESALAVLGTVARNSAKVIHVNTQCH